MKSNDILTAVDSVGKKWTKQIKAEERSRRAGERREYMWTPQRTSLRDICWSYMEDAWDKASGGGRAADPLASDLLRRASALRRGPEL
jgi:hypothetical protein